MNKKGKKRFYLIYTLCFAFLAGIIAFLFYSKGKTLIDYEGDGFRQHYRALVYYAAYLKEIFRNIIHGRFVIPQWDFAIGEGNDIIQTFHYYCLGDIFTVFSVFFPLDKMYLYYDFATLCRMYAAGLAFSCLCFYKKKDDFWTVLTGSLLYGFSEYALAFLSTHVFFISAMVFLPLIILGAEMILNDDRPYLFPIAVCLSALSNIYFFYMNVLSTAIYVTIRILMMEGEIKEKFHRFLRIFVFSLLGLLMSFVIIFPMLWIILSGSRLQSEIISGVFYSLDEYKGLLAGFVYGNHNYFGDYTIVALLAVIYLFFNRKGNRQLKVMFVVGLIMTLIPFFGKLYNAMIYPTGRWLYAMTLLICYIVVDQFDALIKDKQNLIVILAAAAYSGLSIYLEGDFWQVKAMYLFLMVIYAAALRIVKNRKLCSVMCFLFALFCIGFEILYSFSAIGWQMSERGTPISRIEEMDRDEHYLFDDLNEPFFRYSGDGIDTNQGIQGTSSSTQYYWSLANSNVIEYRKAMGLSDHNNHHYDHYDGRLGLNSLAGVRYFVLSKEQVPTGFTHLMSEDGYEVYKSEHCLPLVYAYDSFLGREEFDQLSVEEKNEAVLSAAVIEKQSDLVRKEVFNGDSVELNVSMSFEGMNADQGIIKVNDGNAVMKLDADHDQPGEYYFVIEGLYSDVNSNIVVKFGDVRKTLYFKGPYHSAYGDKHDFIINLGYLKEFKDPIEVSFPNKGEFTYKTIKVVYVDTAKQIEKIKKLNNVRISSLSVTTNRVTSDLSIDKDQILCFSIPYSKGWKAYVDGKKTDLFSCNIAYSGLELEKGTHHIELVYSTPLLKSGALISVFSWIVFIFVACRDDHFVIKRHN